MGSQLFKVDPRMFFRATSLYGWKLPPFHSFRTPNKVHMCDERIGSFALR